MFGGPKAGSDARVPSASSYACRGKLAARGKEKIQYGDVSVTKKSGVVQNGWLCSGGGAYSFVACLSHLTIDHASLSIRFVWEGGCTRYSCMTVVV